MQKLVVRWKIMNETLLFTKSFFFSSSFVVIIVMLIVRMQFYWCVDRSEGVLNDVQS